MINNYFENEYKPYHQVYTHTSGNKIYLGDIAAALDTEFLKNKNISIVITAALGMQHVKYDSNIQHIVYPLLDKKTQNMTKHFLPFYQLTERELKNKNMLVHCFAGISRSSTLVISYLMKKHKWTFKQAITFVRKFRPNVLPNLGFERQLKQYEKQLQFQQQTETRKMISKTSQSRKNNSKQNKINKGLPQIVAFGKTVIKSKIIDPLIIPPGSQVQSRKRKLPTFIQAGLEQKNIIRHNNNDNMQIQHLALKSYRRRSISQANKKLYNLDKINKILKVENKKQKGHKIAPQVNELRFATERLIKPKVKLYDGF